MRSPRHSRSTSSSSSRRSSLSATLTGSPINFSKIQYPGVFTDSDLEQHSVHGSDAGRSDTLAERIILATTQPKQVQLPKHILKKVNIHTIDAQVRNPHYYMTERGGVSSPPFDEVAQLFARSGCEVFKCDTSSFRYQAEIVDEAGNRRVLTSRSDFALLREEFDHKASRRELASAVVAWIEIASRDKSTLPVRLC